MFTLENNIIKINPNLLPIPQLRIIWDRDKDKNKEIAYKELSYIFYVADYKSPYQNLSEDIREDKIRDEFIRDKKWKPDAEIQSAIDEYLKLQETPSLRLLKGAKIAVDKLSVYFKTTEPEDRNYTSNLEKLGRIIESITKLEQQVKKEQTNESRIRGGGEIKNRER